MNELKADIRTKEVSRDRLPWSEITDAEKVERLRKELASCETCLNRPCSKPARGSEGCIDYKSNNDLSGGF